MVAWTSATQPKVAGVVLDPGGFAQHATLDRLPCDPALRAWVDYYWTVQWNLPAGTTYRSSTIPEPNCHLSIEYGGRVREGATQEGIFLTGVMTRRRFDVRLTGSGGVVGVRFRPGGLTAMTGIQAWTMRDRVRQADGLMAVSERLEGLRGTSTGLTGVLDESIAGLPLRGDDQYAAVCDSLTILEASDPSVTVSDLADDCGVGIRRLQRLYRRFIGVGPQWMIARSRVHAALARMHQGQVTTLADLASDLGWFDQAHFNRDFIVLVGESPGEYRRRCSTSPPPGGDVRRPG